MTVYDYCVLHCDACSAPLGWSSDQSHPSRGVTICRECWSNPERIPRHLLSTIPADRLVRTGREQMGWKPGGAA